MDYKALMNPLIMYVLLIVSFETGAMYCFKRGTQNRNWFLGGVLAYAMVGYFLQCSFQYQGLAIVNALWSGLSVAATTLVGVLIFQEHLHWHDYMAVLLIGSGVVLLKAQP